MLTEKRWIPDTAITRKLKKVHDERDGQILVDMPLEVSEFDNHSEHIKAHKEVLKDMLKSDNMNVDAYITVYQHFKEHATMQLQQAQKEMAQPKWVVPKSTSKAQISPVKLPNPPTNTKTREEG